MRLPAFSIPPSASRTIEDFSASLQRSGISGCRRSAAAHCRTRIAWSSRTAQPILAALRWRLLAPGVRAGRRDEDRVRWSSHGGVDDTFSAATADIAGFIGQNQRDARPWRGSTCTIGRFLAARGDGRARRAPANGPCRHASSLASSSLRPWPQQLCVARRALPSKNGKPVAARTWWPPARWNDAPSWSMLALKISDDDCRQGIVSDRVGCRVVEAVAP